MACGANHSGAVTGTGAAGGAGVYMWGNGANSRLGGGGVDASTEQPVPRPVVPPYCPTLLPRPVAPPYCPTLLPHPTAPPYCPALLPRPTAPPYCPALWLYAIVAISRLHLP